MKSSEIQAFINLSKSGDNNKTYDTIGGKYKDIGILFLGEIAYQLALMNEACGIDTKTPVEKRQQERN